MGALDGQTAIVTGAAMGLGASYAELLAEQGCAVVAADMNPQVAETAARLSASGGQVIPVVADVRRPDDIRRLADTALERLGRVDILINNAAICRRTWPTDPVDASLDNYDDLIGTNLEGPFLLGRAVIPTMIAQGGGHIINIATDHVHTFPGRPTNGFGSMDLYDASKWGLIGLTLTWAKALAAHNIRVNAFCMDATDSPMLRFFAGPDVSAESKANWMDPRQVCGLAVELIAEGPGGRTGENIGVWCGFEVALTHTPRPLAGATRMPGRLYSAA
jgi:NAD(P)-dependent dehydrogenase (short-subunit alcohol dehydrogenase family)